MWEPKSETLGRNHVLAKRYLITNTPDYLENLSDASKETFKMQGGILPILKNNRLKTLAKMTFLLECHWDDMAKKF